MALSFSFPFPFHLFPVSYCLEGSLHLVLVRGTLCNSNNSPMYSKDLYVSTNPCFVELLMH